MRENRMLNENKIVLNEPSFVKPRYEDNNSDGIFGYCDDKHGKWWPERQKQTSKKLKKRHFVVKLLFLLFSKL